MKIEEIENQLKQLQEEVEKLKKGKYEEGIVPISGKDYETIKINGLEWLREDLDLDPTFGFSDGVGAWKECERYYFNWTTANIIAREIGDGWRIPTREEFEALYEELGEDFHKVMKPELNGYCDASGDLYHQGTSGYWWSSTPDSVAGAYSLSFLSSAVGPSNGNNKYDGLAVRLVRKVI